MIMKFTILVIAVLVGAACAAEQNKMEKIVIKNVTCSNEIMSAFEQNKNTSSCALKPVLVLLRPRNKIEKIVPSAVWVNRCVGKCYYPVLEDQCVLGDILTKTIYTRVINVKTRVESCATYTLMEHGSCYCNGL